jgi:tRNA/tmRNA/rRNA uracil-C5-methylase (TrmA/RlmC/RlmD family)
LKAPVIWGDVLFYFKGITIPKLYQGSPLHWRHRAKVAVRGTSLHPFMGLFKEHTHEVVPIPNCLVHHPNLNYAFAKVNVWLKQQGLNPYNEKTGSGELRYLQGVVERKTGKVQLTFVLNLSSHQIHEIERWQKLVAELGQLYEELWHSLWLNFNATATNTILGREWKLVFGQKLLWEHFEKVAVCYGPASFGQANLPLFEQMLIQIRRGIPEQSDVVEFYAGVGAIGLFIAQKSHSVVCCEINPFAEHFFNQSKSLLPPSVSSNLKFITASTSDSLSLLKDATTVIIDPPRKGLDNSFFSVLERTDSVEKLIYVSCGWDSFKRDCKRLCENGWRIENVQGYVFFPGTNHIELLVFFEKNLPCGRLRLR